jgi:hypothetical protein
MYLVSFILGLMIVIGAILLIRRELNRAVRSQALLLQQSRVYKDADLFELLESLQSSIDEMNRAFYDIAGDLEGKYSIHEKEIQLLNEKVDMHLAKLANHEKKLVGIEKAAIQQMPSRTVKENIEQMNNSTVKEAQPEMTASPNEILNDGDTEVLTKIIELRSQGKSLPQIAKELGIGMGELQLLITLKK